MQEREEQLAAAIQPDGPASADLAGWPALLRREQAPDARFAPDFVASAEVNEWAAKIERQRGNERAARVHENLAAIYRDQVRRRRSAPQPL